MGMWTIFHIKYCDTHPDRYTLYVKCDGETTMASNYQEPGLNYGGKPKIDYPSLKNFDSELIAFPAPEKLLYLGWNGKEEKQLTEQNVVPVDNKKWINPELMEIALGKQE